MKNELLNALSEAYPAVFANVEYLRDTDTEKHTISWWLEEIMRRGVTSVKNQRKQATIRDEQKRTSQNVEKFNAWLKSADGVKIATTDPVKLLAVMKSYGIGAESVIQAAKQQQEQHDTAAA